MARFTRTSGVNNAGTNWDLHVLSGGKYSGYGIRRWDGNEYYYGKMVNGTRLFGAYHWGNGNCSFGEFSDNKRNGKTLFIYGKDPSNIDYYFGNWKNDSKHGKGVYVFSDGSWFYGDWQNDKKQGVRIYYNADDGYAYYQTFNNNEKTSSTKIPYYLGFNNQFRNVNLRLSNLPYSPMEYRYDHSGNNDYEFNGNISNGQWHGFATLEWSSHAFFGEYSYGKRTVGAYYYSNSTYFGQLLNCNYHGVGLTFNTDNTNYFGNFYNGKRQGMGFFLYTDGSMLFTNFNNGEADGIGLMIKPNYKVDVYTYSKNKYINTLYSYTHSGSTTSNYSNVNSFGTNGTTNGAYKYSSGVNNAGTNWELYERQRGQFVGSGIRRWGDGSYYYGTMKNGSRIFGNYYWPNGESCFGYSSDNLRDGMNLYIYGDDPNDLSYFVGTYKAGKRNGRGFDIFSDGSFAYSDWVNGNKEGNRIYFDASSGYIKFQTMRNDKEQSAKEIPHFFGFSQRMNDSTLYSKPASSYPIKLVSSKNNQGTEYDYVGQVAPSGTWHGIGLIEWLDGGYSCYMGEMNNGSKGTGVWYNKNYTYFGQYVNNNRHGYGIYFYDDGEVYFGGWKEDRRHGPGFYFHNDGSVSYGIYENGKLNGKVLGVNKNFEVKEHIYKDSKWIENIYTFNGSSTSTYGGYTEPVTKPKTTNVKSSINNSFSTSTNTNVKPKVKQNHANIHENDPIEMFEKCIGLTNVKPIFENIIDEVVNNKNKHNMIFKGNSGTGKSYLADIYTGILYDNELSINFHPIELDIKQVLDSDPYDSDKLIQKAFRKAKDTVLVINNCSYLTSTLSYNSQSISIIRKSLVDQISKTKDVSMIFTCLNDELKDLENILSSVMSCINYKIEFSDFSNDEFRDLAVAYISEKGYTVEDDALDLIVEKIDRNRRYMSFANVKDLYSIIDQAIKNCSERCEDELDEDDEEYGLIIYDDVVTVIA